MTERHDLVVFKYKDIYLCIPKVIAEKIIPVVIDYIVKRKEGAWK